MVVGGGEAGGWSSRVDVLEGTVRQMGVSLSIDSIGRAAKTRWLDLWLGILTS